MPRRTISGKTSAALPQSPTDMARRAARASSIIQRVVERWRCGVEIANFDPLCDAGGIDLDAQDCGIGHLAGERLRAAHAAETGREHESAGEVAAEMFAPRSA